MLIQLVGIALHKPVAGGGPDLPDLLRRALEIVKRAAAVDTGAIEGLDEVDRGITLTVAVAAVLWEAAPDQKGQHARALFASQLRGAAYVLALATEQVPITEAWIRDLHEKTCEARDLTLHIPNV